MKGSLDGGERSVAYESEHRVKTNCRRLALEISTLEEFVIGTSSSNRNSNSTAIGDAGRADATQSASRTMGAMGAASLLWGREPTMTAPMITSESSSSSSSSSTSSDKDTNATSPASNAAAVLLVGMSKRKEQETNDHLKRSTDHAANPSVVAANATTAGPTEKDSGIEMKWQRIRLDISSKVSNQTNSSESSVGERQEEGLRSIDLPKGVTRRPSGAWQAQIYFAGKTRYIGVWERAHQAATAYNMTKEALKELKAQQKSNGAACRKRQRQSDTQERSKARRKLMMTTPQKESKPPLPPSITWPSSASSSSTSGSSSADSRSLSDAKGPFKKRLGQGISPLATLSNGVDEDPRSKPGPPENFLSILQHQQGTQSGHPYSAFPQHLYQQHTNSMGGASNPNANLIHPGLQLMSLRQPQQRHPPPPTAPWLRAQLPPPHPYHHQRHFHPAFQQFQYSQPLPRPQVDLALTNNGRKTAKIQDANKKASSMAKVGKKTVKNKTSKTSTANTNCKNPAKSISSKTKDCTMEAQNAKWKAIRAEVLAIFNGAKKLGISTEGYGYGPECSKTKTFDKEVLRGITVRPSGKFQAQLYFGGRSRYIGVFNSEYEAASAYEMIRSRLKNERRKEGKTLSTPSIHWVKKDKDVKATAQAVKKDKDVKATAQAVKKDKDVKATALMVSPSTLTRSITPSPTPRNDLNCKAGKFVTYEQLSKLTSIMGGTNGKLKQKKRE